MKRGRPRGYKMSEKSKQTISRSKLGQTHTEKTKLKISEGVKKYHETGAPINILMNTNLQECGTFIKSGYISVGIPNPNIGEPSYQQRYHVALVEQFLGRKLIDDEEVHHWGDKYDNDINKLSLCKNRKEHKMLDKIKNRLQRQV